MDAEVYPQPHIAKLIQDRFVPVRVHVKDDREAFKRLGEKFNAQWTPTILIVDPPGTERHRIEGALPADEFASQLDLGLAKSAFARGQFADAERAYAAIIEKYPNTDAAPEAQYWAGVSRYKGTGDAGALAETARRFGELYKDSAWARKASVWA
ncbi:MAG: thioredoxin fold domain-containing protein [Vicinamibacterales bacterium]